MLTINLEWDQNALAAPPSFRNGVQDAANILESAIYDPITVNVAVGYGEYDDGGISYQPLTDDYSLGGINASIEVSYPALTAALAANATSPSEIKAVNALPETTSLNGQTNFFIATAQAKAFGVIPATDPMIDGYAGFPATFTGSGLVDTAITELAHAMGLLNGSGTETLVQYTSPGNHFLTSGASTIPAYLSIDGGRTNLANFAVGFDSTLFENLNDDPLDFPSTGGTLTPLDLTVLSVLGYDVTATPAVPTPSIAPATTSSGAVSIVNTQNITVTENSSVSALLFIKSVMVPSGASITSYAFYDQGNDNGYFSINGVAEPDNQWIYVLDTQLTALRYFGGASPGRETLEVAAYDTPDTLAQTSQLTATTMAPAPPTIVNNADGTSYLYTYNPTSTVAETIATYSGANATGTMISDIVDNSDGTALIYAYNPSSTTTLTSQDWSATDATNGAPSGSQVSEVVDNTDGTALVYAYNPSSTVTQTTQDWSATNAANGAPAGSEISDVVDNTDGTALLYSYNPTSTVTQTTAEYSATDSSNGAPAGMEISDVVDNTDGTSILYAYNPTGSITQTATYYSSDDPSTGAPAGTVTSETADYTNGASAITADAPDGASTTYYGGADGTGAVIGGTVAAAFDATPPAPGTPDTVASAAAIAPAAQAGAVADNAMITPAGSNQFIDLGTGNHTIQFIPGGTADTLLLPTAGTDQLLGFDPAAGDMLDLSALFAAAGLTGGYAIAPPSSYVSVVNLNGSAQVLFDPAGHGGGSQVALLVNAGALVPQLQTLTAFLA